MIKDNQTLLNRIHVVVDALVIACTYIAAWFIQFEFFAPDVAGKLPLETYMSALVILIPGLLHYLCFHSCLQIRMCFRCLRILALILVIRCLILILCG